MIDAELPRQCLLLGSILLLALSYFVWPLLPPLFAAVAGPLRYQ